MEKEKLSLTEKPRWEIIVSSKLDEYGVQKKHHDLIIKGIEGVAPMMVIFIPCLLIWMFNKDH